MPHLGIPEIALLLAVALLILGPRALPELLGRLSQNFRQLLGGPARQVRGDADPEDEARLRS